MEKTLTTSTAKDQQRTDNEDRSIPFKKWHRQQDPTFYASDCDLIEWRFRDGKFVPVAVLELTRTDSDDMMNPRYLEQIQKRFFYRDIQAMFARETAARLGCPAYVVLFRSDCSEFWVSEIAPDRFEWMQFTPRDMQQWLSSL